MATAANTRETFTSDFARVRGRLAGQASPWLASLRDEAMAAFDVAGFPTVRNEDWKYTSVASVLRERLEPVLADEVTIRPGQIEPLLARGAALEAATCRLVFVDGCFQASLSRLPATRGLRVSSLRERLASQEGGLEDLLGKYLPLEAHGFAALNTAFLDDGAVVEIAEGAVVEDPIHVAYVSTTRERPYVTYPRNVIAAGASSSARVVEHYLGAADARCLTNSAAEIVVSRGATLGHVRIQDESPLGFHVARIQVEQAEGSCFESHAFAFGAALSRTEIAVRLAGEEAECRLSGLYAIDGSRHVDHHLMVDHASPRTRSRQLYKGVLEDSSRGVFTGRVVVRPDSQKIQASQSNPSLLLGRRAVAETRPQLEIYADDVACNHGATIGRLDDNALFYLLSRGIEPREARRILVSGFATEVVEAIGSSALREQLTQLVARHMGDLGREAPSPTEGAS